MLAQKPGAHKGVFLSLRLELYVLATACCAARAYVQMSAGTNKLLLVRIFLAKGQEADPTCFLT